MFSSWEILAGVAGAGVLLKYHAVLRKAGDNAASTVKSAGGLVPPSIATGVTVGSLALDAFDDSQIAQEFARRMADAASQAHLDTVLSEIRTAALARFTAISSATPAVAPPHPATIPPPKA